jgi:hypothetical protein
MRVFFLGKREYYLRMLTLILRMRASSLNPFSEGEGTLELLRFLGTFSFTDASFLFTDVSFLFAYARVLFAHANYNFVYARILIAHANFNFMYARIESVQQTVLR